MNENNSAVADLPLPIIPPNRPILKSKSTGSFEDEEGDQNGPRIPLKRPQKEPHNNEIDKLVKETNKELHEMEELLNKHLVGPKAKDGQQNLVKEPLSTSKIDNSNEVTPHIIDDMDRNVEAVGMDEQDPPPFPTSRPNRSTTLETGNKSADPKIREKEAKEIEERNIIDSPDMPPIPQRPKKVELDGEVAAVLPNIPHRPSKPRERNDPSSTEHLPSVPLHPSCVTENSSNFIESNILQGSTEENDVECRSNLHSKGSLLNEATNSKFKSETSTPDVTAPDFEETIQKVSSPIPEIPQRPNVRKSSSTLSNSIFTDNTEQDHSLDSDIVNSITDIAVNVSKASESFENPTPVINSERKEEEEYAEEDNMEKDSNTPIDRQSHETSMNSELPSKEGSNSLLGESEIGKDLTKPEYESIISNDDIKSMTGPEDNENSEGKDKVEDSENMKEKNEIPNIPCRPKKKAPPPVPKKPSSRIAAFHEMLQKQQENELAMRRNEVSDEGTSPREESEKKTNFVNNLNGLFALPGMSPLGGLPERLNKKLSDPSVMKPEATGDNPSPRGASLADVRQKRAKGPRGRKLPSKMNNIMKVADNSKKHTMEVFDTWSINFSQRDLKTEEVGVKQMEDQLLITENNELKDIQTDSRNSTPESDERSKSTDQQSLKGDVSTSESMSSLEDSVLARDQDDMAIVLEQNMEDEAEMRMQETYLIESEEYEHSEESMEDIGRLEK